MIGFPEPPSDEEWNELEPLARMGWMTLVLLRLFAALLVFLLATLYVFTLI